MVLIALWLAIPAGAAPSVSPARPGGSQHSAESLQPRPIGEVIDDAARYASAKFQVSPELLNAVKGVESKGHPWALCVNLGGGRSHSVYPRSYDEAVLLLRNLKTDNIDIGPWQVNYHHIGRKAGLKKEDLLNPYVGAVLAAWKLSSEIRENGYTWSAVGNYHSRTPHLKVKWVKRLKQQLRRDGYVVAN